LTQNEGAGCGIAAVRQRILPKVARLDLKPPFHDVKNQRLGVKPFHPLLRAR
jgi:hypothetical protein